MERELYLCPDISMPANRRGIKMLLPSRGIACRGGLHIGQTWATYRRTASHGRITTIRPAECGDLVAHFVAHISCYRAKLLAPAAELVGAPDSKKKLMPPPTCREEQL